MPNNESVFARWLDPEKEPPAVDPAIKLLEWLTFKWSRPTITATDLYQYGPNALRDRKSVMNLTGVLVSQGRLIPIKKRRHDSRE
jgi:hypothetical protein